MRKTVSAAAIIMALSAPAAAQSAFDSKALPSGSFSGPSGVPMPSSSAPAASAAPAVRSNTPMPAAAPAPVKAAAPAGNTPAPETQAAPAENAAAQPAAAPVKKVVKRAPPPAPKERGIVSNDPTPALTADTLRLTGEAVERYRRIAEAGGWPHLPAATKLQLGAKGAGVQDLRRRLAAEGDLPAVEGYGAVFDKTVQDGVKAFQARHGLARSGVVAGATLKAMNVTVEQRIRQLEHTAQRLSERTLATGPRYVVVNIPSASVEAVENGVVEKRYVAVVGKPENASPEVDTRIGTVNINPTWTLPTSIIKNEIIPKMRKDPGYLGRAGIRMLDRSGREVSTGAIDWSGNSAVNYTLRQDSGVRNALGQIRIDMPNRDAVYMHDTPSKRFFASQDRFYSHGCVRVQDVKGFAAWLLEGTGGSWDKSAIDAAIAIGERKDVRLARPVPVSWVYMTGYGAADGKVHFRDDVYGLDTPQAVASLQARRAKALAQREARAAEARAAAAQETTASIPASGPAATGQMIDPPVQDMPRRGWLWW